MEERNDKRVLHIALDDEVKKVSIAGKNGDEKVVMRQELSEDDLEQATGAFGSYVGAFRGPLDRGPLDNESCICKRDF